MLCKNPYIKDAIPFGCGQCLPCRINRRRLWTHRILLESRLHDFSSFVTLTYRDDELSITPQGYATLVPGDVKKWMKRIRKKYELKLRFFLVGEYGEKTARPHYHVILFGYPSCQKPERRDTLKYKGKICECQSCEIIAKTWKKGFIWNDEVNENTIQYTAQYTVKKLTNKNDKKVIEWLKDRHPEFARMSNRPGIGADSMDKMVEILESEHGVKLLEQGDVPSVLKHGKKSYPIGRYLKRKIREKMGWKETGCPKEILQVMREENIQEYIQDRNSKALAEIKGQKEFLLHKNTQAVRRLESRNKIFNTKKGEI